MASGQQVLLVDGISETEEVLKAVLEPRGLQVNRVRGHCTNQRTKTSLQPHVVVIHTDSKANDPLADEEWTGVPRVIIGSSDTPPSLPSPTTTTDQYLSHPFQYSELIQTIEQLLHDNLA